MGSIVNDQPIVLELPWFLVVPLGIYDFLGPSMVADIPSGPRSVSASGRALSV